MPATSSFCNPYTTLSIRVISTRMIASTIATVAHFMSDPKMIGIGPTMTTPPPLTCAPSVLASESMAIIITPSPAKTSTTPARMRSAVMRVK